MAPYDKVPHAGGQIENYHVKKINSDSRLNLKLISFCSDDEYEKISADLHGYNVDFYIIPRSHKMSFSTVKRAISYRLGMANPFDKYGGATYRYYLDNIKAIIEKLNSYSPDIVILQWTQIGIFLPEIKALYPNAKFVMIEEDVMFLSYQRKMDQAQGLRKKFAEMRFKSEKKYEVKALKQADLIVLNNPKDEKLVNDLKIYNTWYWTPYFHSMLDVSRDEQSNNDIIFYGAMHRKENRDTVIWFIENVLNKLSDLDVRFVIVGSKPSEDLYKYKSERVIITGFVDDVSTYFRKALCLAAPLVMGAGVKIKVLEAMSAGIPVITNHIGIEGIPAEDKKDYLNCETPDEYVKAITLLYNDRNYGKVIGEHGREFIRSSYNFENDAETFKEKLLSL